MKKRHWANVTVDFFQSRDAARSSFDTEEERSRSKDDGRGHASRTSENPRTRTTLLQVPFEVILERKFKETLIFEWK